MNARYLETERTFLRSICYKDEDILYCLNSDPEVMKWLTNGKHMSRDAVRERLSFSIDINLKTDNKFGYWAVIEKGSGYFLGWLHLRPGINNHESFDKVELGYRFFKKFWGEGFATEGSRVLIENAFINLNVKEIFATTMKKNLASRKVLEKLNFKLSHEYHDERFPIEKERAVFYVLKNGEL